MVKRRKIRGELAPMDRITHNNNNNQASLVVSGGGSKKNRVYRKDPKIVKNINNNLVTKEFVFSPDSVPKASVPPTHHNNNNIKSFTANHTHYMITDKDMENYSRKLISSPPSSNDPGDEADPHILEINKINKDKKNREIYTFESPNNISSPLERPHTSGKGLLQSSPITSGPSSLFMRMMGTLKIINERGSCQSISQVPLKFKIDRNGCFVTFQHKEEDLLTRPLSLENDCDILYFDSNCTCLGISLNKTISIFSEVGDGGIKLRTRLILWENNELRTQNGLSKIKNMLSHFNIKCNVEILSKHIDVMDTLKAVHRKNFNLSNENMANSTLKNIFNQQSNIKKNSFLNKQFFNSLSAKRKHTSSTYRTSSTATRIQIPNHNTEINQTSMAITPVKNISASSFYSNVSSPTKSYFIDNNKIQLNVRRSTRNLDKPQNSSISKVHNLDPEEFDEPYEEPEEFKPSLKQKFRDNSCYTVTNQDFKCLYNNDWINDSIIDFFIKFYVEKSIDRNVIKREDVYIMSSFFYTKLISDHNQLYANVKKWVQHSDLMNRKYVVIPINVSYHWFGCIITNLDLYHDFMLKNKNVTGNNKLATNTNNNEVPSYANSIQDNIQNENGSIDVSNEKTIHTNDTSYKIDTGSFTESSKDSTVTTTNKDVSSNDNECHEDVSLSCPIIEILTFDSLRGTHSREVDPIKEFIIAYAKDKYNMLIDKECIKMKTCLVPQQPNMSDCGVYVISTISKFFEDPILTMDVWRNAKNKSRQSSKIVNDYFEKTKRNRERKNLRAILKQLLAAQIERTGIKSEDDDKNMNGDEDDEDVEIIEDISKHASLPNKQDCSEEKERHNRNGDVTKEINVPTHKDNHRSISKISDDLTSDPPVSPQEELPKMSENRVPFESQKSRLSSSPNVSPIDKYTDIAIPTEAIANTDFLESSPIKYHSVHQNKKIVRPITSPFFNKMRILDQNNNEIDKNNRIPPLQESRDNYNTERYRTLRSPNKYIDDSLNEDTSHSVVVSDVDEDVRLVGATKESSPVVSNDRPRINKRGTAEVISEKMERELNEKDTFDIPDSKSAQTDVLIQGNGNDVSKIPPSVIIKDDTEFEAANELISLDDD